MFKDLFQATSLSNKGIAGIKNVKLNDKKSAGTSIDEESISPTDQITGPKLISAKKTEELQVGAQADGRQLNKNRSKKDLKNKFKSSSAIYANGIKTSEPEDEDEIKDNDTKNISDIIQRHIQKEEAEKENKGTAAKPAFPVPAGIDSMMGLDNLKKQPNYAIDDSEIDEIIKQHLEEE